MRDHLSIRRLTEADLDVAADILAAAYDNPASSRSASLRHYLSVQPDGWLLATLDGRAVGVGGAVNYGPFASIGSVGVRPEAQRRGVARALMERLLAWLEAADCQVVVLVATDAGAPLYQALGFVEDGATLVFRRTATLPPPEPPPMAPRVSPLRADDLPALVRFDAPIFGASRPSVLAGYHADDPARAYIARDEGGEVAGYLFAQAQTVGPWAARTPGDAEALLSRALALSFDEVARAVAPSQNEEAARLLRRHDFEGPFMLRHMRRGGNALPGVPAMLYGRASFAIG